MHANQRITLFRYYIIFATLYATGTGFLFIRFPYDRVIHEILVIGVSITFIIITIVFQLLDKRNRELIHLSEDALKKLESQAPFTDKKLQIFTQEQSSSRCIRHSNCFFIIFLVSYILGGIFITAAIISIGYYTLC